MNGSTKKVNTEKSEEREKPREGKEFLSIPFPLFFLSFPCLSLLKITGEKAAVRWAGAAEARLEVALVSAGECVELVLSEKLNEMNQTDDLLYLYTMNAGTEIKLYLAIGAKDSYRHDTSQGPGSWCQLHHYAQHVW